MWNRAKRLFSPLSVPGWVLALWKPLKWLYELLNGASNADWARQHMGNSLTTFFAAYSYWLAMGVGFLWLALLVLKPEKPEPTRKLDEAKQTVSNKHFFSETVQLDGRTFEGCTFTSCRLEYRGTGKCLFVNCKVRERYLIITYDPAVNVFLNAQTQLKEAASPSISLWGKQNQTTGEFSGDVGHWMDAMKDAMTDESKDVAKDDSKDG
jgi:hypothetical protein